MNVSDYPARLRAGDVVQIGAEDLRVTMVNQCRAHVEPVSARKLKVFTTLTGKIVTVPNRVRGLDISPNSEIPILGHEDARMTRYKVRGGAEHGGQGDSLDLLESGPAARPGAAGGAGKEGA